MKNYCKPQIVYTVVALVSEHSQVAQKMFETADGCLQQWFLYVTSGSVGDVWSFMGACVPSDIQIL